MKGERGSGQEKCDTEGNVLPTQGQRFYYMPWISDSNFATCIGFGTLILLFAKCDTFTKKMRRDSRPGCRW